MIDEDIPKFELKSKILGCLAYLAFFLVIVFCYLALTLREGGKEDCIPIGPIGIIMCSGVNDSD